MNFFPNLRRGFGQSGSGHFAESAPKSAVPSPQHPRPPSGHPHNPAILGQPRMTPTALDKIFLTWSGRFKNKAEIPGVLDGDVIHRARSYARIRINLGFLLFAALSGAGFIYWGKEDRKKGHSMERSNLEWHKQVNEEYKKSGGDAK